MIGAESLAGMYVGEIAPGASSVPARQLCDDVIFVMSGRGTTTVETAKGPMSFEWGPNSLFAIPLNHRYQLHNTSGKEPARFVSVNTIPIVYNLFRDAKFVFGGATGSSTASAISSTLRTRSSTSPTPSTKRPR